MTKTAPSPLQQLLADPSTPLERLALAIARDAYPRLDEEAILKELDTLAAPLLPRLARARGTLAQAGVLGTYLFDELGFRGDEENYYDPRNSYLNEVLVRRRGIPISLAILLVAIGTRAGLTLEGISFPGHFLVRLGGPNGIFLDPFFHARMLPTDAIERLLKRAAGNNAQLTPELLQPASPTTITIRMLTNLKAIYESRQEHARALVVCDRLVELTDAIEHRRDRGLHALALGARATAEDDFKAYLSERPDATDASNIHRLLDRSREPTQSKLN